MASLVGIENPLLDIMTEVDADFLARYGLKADDAILASPQHLPIYDEIVKRTDVQYVAGGACQNSIRVCQWTLQTPKTAAFIGCVGNDESAATLRKVAEAAGAELLYLVDPNEPTGRCAVLLNGKNRSMVTQLAAANCYKKEHLDRPDIWAKIEHAHFFYSTGYFLTVSPPSVMQIAEHAAATNKLFAFNLAAPFIAQFFSAPLLAILPYADVLFGNETEAVALAEAAKFGTTDLREIALKVAALPKANASRPRVVVITHGAHPTIVVENGVATEYPVLPIDPKDIVDSNGAGDAFVGGYLAQVIRGKSVKECIRTAQYTARVILTQPGCTYPASGPDAAYL